MNNQLTKHDSKQQPSRCSACSWGISGMHIRLVPALLIAAAAIARPASAAMRRRRALLAAGVRCPGTTRAGADTLCAIALR
jgi:hypothetical protein